MTDFAEMTTSELTTGLRDAGDQLTCAVCGTNFQAGIIYPLGDKLMDSRAAAATHVQSEHGGMLKVLLDLPGDTTGLSDIQRTVIAAIADGKPDREIARALGGRAESTVRNHRFQLRKRFAEARVLAAIAELLQSHEGTGSGFITYHADIPVTDERIVTTIAEAQAILSRHTDQQDGLKLLKFPKKEKEKLVLLRRITEEFDRTTRYTEQQVNGILAPIYHDYVTIRRYLIEYRFLGRRPDGSEYWVNA